MIVKVPRIVIIFKLCNNKCRWYLNDVVNSRQFKSNGGSRFLIHFHLYNFYLVPATPMLFFDFHAAGGTNFIPCREPLHSGKPVHTIMKINDDAAGDRQVANKRKGCNKFFHYLKQRYIKGGESEND